MHLSDSENQFNCMAYSRKCSVSGDMPSFAYHGSAYIRPFLVFLVTEASLLVRKACDILNTTRNTSQ